MSMKNTMKIINAEAKRLSTIRDTENARRFSSYLLAIITYLRQSVVCPILPIANVALDMSDYDEKSELSNILLKEVNMLKIGDWFNNENSILSSRMKNVLEVINKHQDERLVIFTCFRSCLDIFKKQLPTDRINLTLSSTMTTNSRAKTLETFGKSENGILLLTYELGAEGLNLQISHTILLMDLWWNSGKTQQAIARVLRFGQQSSCVNVYYFTSNTGIEKAVFNKHEDKLIILDEIQEGPLKSSVKEMKVNEIIAIVEKEDNALHLNNINNRVCSTSRNVN
jgi:SNF2 family DNA or RNA helicase